MKKYFFIMILASFFCFSCDDDDNGGGSINPVTNVTSTSFIGSVILNWENPVDEDFYYVLVSYVNNAGETVKKKVDKFSVNENGIGETIIGGFFDTQDYQFSLTAYSLTGASSTTVTVVGKPKNREEAKDYVINSVVVEPDFSAAKVSWVNETGVSVNLSAEYLDLNGDVQIVSIDATYSGSKVLPNMEGKTVVKVIAENVDGGDKTEAKSFTVAVKQDPDDIIYDDIDYITFGFGVNGLSWLQSNPANPYEYKFETSGGDPFIHCNGMVNPIKGNTIVFRYKSTEAFTLEFYWCNAGGGAAGGRSTTVSVPENNTGAWATFRYDYSEAMSEHSWAGKVGDFIRFDLGNKAGLTIQMKNIHFE